MGKQLANKRKYRLLPYPIIEAATQGNVSAINAVLKHYDSYIATLSTRMLYDENGNSSFLHR